MPGDSPIGWTDATYNPVSGCTVVTAGCQNCYAATLHNRRHAIYQANGGLWTPGGKPMPKQYAVPFETVLLLPERLEWPLHVKQPKMIFVNSVSDLLHSAVPDDFIRQVFDVMRRAHWHQFQVLTKRAGRLRTLGPTLDWPSNVWMGVSIEEDKLVGRADALRIGAAKAAVRFISAEPLLGPLDHLSLVDINWLIVGSESGAHARPMSDDWVRQLRDRCAGTGIAFFFKQRSDPNGHKKEHPLLDGMLWEQFPEKDKQSVLFNKPPCAYEVTQLRAERLTLPEDALPVAWFHDRQHQDKVYGLYRRDQAQPMPPKREPKDYTPVFVKRYATRRAAYLEASEALFSLNRWAKHPGCAINHQRLIYDLKNRWITKLWREGFCMGAIEARSPERTSTCWECEGEGCYRCDDSGIYRKTGGRSYWAFKFSIGERIFAWHQPAHLCPWASPVGEEQPHEVLAEKKPVELAARHFAVAKALLAWVLGDEKEAQL